MISMSPATAVLSGAFIYFAYYFTYYSRKPEFFIKNGTRWARFLENHVSSLKLKYSSLFWVPGGTIQTVVAALLPTKHDVQYRRESVATPDGGQFTIAWTNEKAEEGRPIVFVYPGLVSTTKSKYVQLLTDALVKEDHTVVVMVNRGLELPCLTGKAFCATHTTDLAQALSLVKKRHPQSPIVSIGISLGGLIMARYLAQKGDQSDITAAFLYSCPFNPVEGSANLERWHHWILYNISLTKELKEIYLKSHDKFVGIVDHDKVMSARSIREIDMHFTSKVFGYESVDHYYTDAIISRDFLHSIKTPTLALCADDDAFVPYQALPRDEISSTDYVALAVTSGGGHVSHLCGANPYTTPYYVTMFVDYVQAVLSHLDELPPRQ
ncbi:unnamed protein product [Clavelina lepadiformis]|uniref:Serine aminopeptidase S33 domain-containing protein n=1 Tax=Clavelina lepadiformis TaxID=159417 RepID=A0ABP0GST6_CLALP